MQTTEEQLDALRRVAAVIINEGMNFRTETHPDGIEVIMLYKKCDYVEEELPYLVDHLDTDCTVKIHANGIIAPDTWHTARGGDLEKYMRGVGIDVDDTIGNIRALAKIPHIIKDDEDSEVLVHTGDAPFADVRDLDRDKLEEIYENPEGIRRWNLDKVREEMARRDLDVRKKQLFMKEDG